jgi:hypothetical protein
LLVLRGVLVGLPLLPPATRATADEVPRGFLHFFQRAAISERATQTFLWGVWGKNYSEIREHKDWDSFLPNGSPAAFQQLFGSLAAQPDGQTMTAVLDNQFEAEAGRLARVGGLGYRARALVLRGYRMWTASESIFGWFYLDQTGHGALLRRLADSERLLFLALLLVSLACARDPLARNALAWIVAFVCLRTVFLAYVGALEIRYLIQFGAFAPWALIGGRPGEAQGTLDSSRS